MPLFPITTDTATAEFLAGAARGEFLLVHDKVTGDWLEPSTDTTANPDRYQYLSARGYGTIVSWSIGHNRRPDGTTHPSLFGIVQLDEGPWWWTELLGNIPDTGLTGARVHVGFKSSGPGPGDTTIPCFVIDIDTDRSVGA